MLIDELNSLVGIEGFIFENYAEGGEGGRLYFSSENAKKIDAIRQKIEEWKKRPLSMRLKQAILHIFAPFM